MPTFVKAGLFVGAALLLALSVAAYADPALQISLQSAFAACFGWVAS